MADEAGLRAVSRAAADFAAGHSGPIGVAVSGGGDSLAALLALHAVAAGRVFAATVDHGLRAASLAEAEGVGRLCAARGIQHQILSWNADDGAGNLSARARAARYALLKGWAQRTGIAAVVVAHNREDLAETFLMNLGRSAGIDGLAAMRDSWTQGSVTFYRPFLGCSRTALRAWLQAQGQAWVDDPSNADPHYQRVKVRQVLPALEQAGIDAASIASTAAHLSSERAALDWALGTAIGDATTAAGEVVVPLDTYRSLPDALRRRLLMQAVDWIAGAGYPPRGAALSAVAQALADGAGRRTLGGCVFSSGARVLRIAREPAAVAAGPVPLGQVFDGRWGVVTPASSLGDEVIAPLGAAISQFPAWRRSGFSRAALISGPAIWQDGRMIAAPLLQPEAKWTLELVRNFRMTRVSH
ncbi:tRNA(Ile)-lysidine synthase [Ketogulonicigenium robustum]|uniref:tRNA(Ile)-lysidine synthase n=1 Tax=Ketogulonicigenium robustum TaxID=92947 RepID=A0A1W6P189_9RHOB|nr:tRNA lysidine(34) synthetase TilS [Ketogulonicigenium robustum]ARO15090.1 tRNA(Ile)-lysidine synthase [Ketogulonicigenium robustum]